MGKVILHYYDGQTYTYTDKSVVKVWWGGGKLMLQGLSWLVDLSQVEWIEERDTFNGKTSVYYRPPSPNSKGMSVKLDVMSSRKRAKTNGGIYDKREQLKKLEEEWVDWLRRHAEAGRFK